MKAIRTLLVIYAGILLSGCALTVDEIDVPYQGKANISVVDGADQIKVSVSNTDNRTVYKDRVSSKKNGYGMEMAAIIATNDVSETFRDAVAFELESLGFQVVEDGDADLNVGLVRFYNDFKIGMFAGDAVADGLINIVVKDKSGDLIFSKSYEGGAIEADIQLASGSNARLALIGAMADIVSKIANDKDLHQSLLSIKNNNEDIPTS
ncbi:YajG family lipoprotein [Thalassospira tepidiphila]|uniref:YajG family lipoprotein n=1 Tax=Thalassospira tepidiphila TaxID=393657 RepID=UPI003AA9981B